MSVESHSYVWWVCVGILLISVAVFITYLISPSFSISRQVSRVPAWELEAYDIVTEKGDLTKLADIIHSHPESVFALSIALQGLLEISMIVENCEATELILDFDHVYSNSAVIDILDNLLRQGIVACRDVWLDSNRKWDADQEAEIRALISDL